MDRFIIIKNKRKDLNDTNEVLQIFSNTLGLFNDRDRERSCFRIFVELVKAEKERERLSSDELAENANLSRATVIHHIEKLEDFGLIKERKHRYYLAKTNFEDLIDFLKKDMDDIFKDLKRQAKYLDKEIGLK